MQIYAELKSDHRDIRRILHQMQRTTSKNEAQRQNLLKQLKEALIPHARAKEMVLYDRLIETREKQAIDFAYDGYEEHEVLEQLIEELESTPPNQKKWGALFRLLKETLEHHLGKEEGWGYQKVEELFDRKAGARMGAAFSRIKLKVERERGPTRHSSAI